MTSQAEVAPWNTRARLFGHTGYTDPVIYGYDQEMRLSALRETIRSFFKVPRRRSALDIGCGSGDVVELLRSENFDVTGVDFSHEVMSKTRERFRGVPNVSLIEGDLRDAKFGNGLFDLVTSVTVLQHTVDDRVCKEIIRSLGERQPTNGLFIILESSPVSKRGFSVNSRVFKSSPAVTVQRKMRPRGRWIEMFEGCGYEFIGETYHPQVGIQLAGYFAAASSILHLNRRAVQIAILRLFHPFERPSLPIPHRFRRTRILVFQHSNQGGSIRARQTRVTQIAPSPDS